MKSPGKSRWKCYPLLSGCAIFLPHAVGDTADGCNFALIARAVALGGLYGLDQLRLRQLAITFDAEILGFALDVCKCHSMLLCKVNTLWISRTV